jgi:hypothetical protein
MRTLLGTILALCALTGAAVADNTCAAPKSCAEWSDWYDIGRPNCDRRFFKGGCVIDQPQERFRVCSYKDRTQCVETQSQAQTTASPFCGD